MLHQLQAAHHPALSHCRVHAAREAVACLRLQALGVNRLADIDVVPGCPFEQHGTGVIADLGFLTPHHPGNREGAGSVANQHSEIVQRALDAVQGGQAFAGMRGAGDDRRCFAARPPHQDIVVEGMQGLAYLQHGVVGCIDDIIDRAHAAQAQSLLHPVRAWLDLDILDQAEHKARVKLRLLDFDGGHAGNARSICMHLKIWLAQNLACQSSYFARYSQDIGVSGDIRRDGNIQYRIAHIIHQGHSGWGVVIQQDNAFMLIGNAQLLFGASH